MKANRILFVAQEIVPFTVSNETSERCRHLPQDVQEMGHETRTFMPKWGDINERRNQLHEVIRLSGMNIIISDTDHPLIIKVASLQMARMQIYFIENDDYFSHLRISEPDLLQPGFADNDERAIFFSRGVLETVKKLRWTPDVIHIHGWIGALIGLYVKVLYKDEPTFRNSKIVLSLYDAPFAEPFRDDLLSRITTRNMDAFDAGDIKEPFTYTTFMKLALRFADGLIIETENPDAEVVDYARQLGLPVLEYPQENYAAACNDFYELVAANEE